MKYRKTVKDLDGDEVWEDSGDKAKGKCPRCGSSELDYQAVEPEESWLYYPFTCKKCKADGKEYYNLEYTDSIVIKK